MRRIAILGIALIALTGETQAQQAAAVQAAPVLSPTNHPRLPRDLSQLWLVPSGRGQRSPMTDALEMAVRLEGEGNFTKALALLSQPALWQGPLGPYAEYYKGVAELRLSRLPEARDTFRAVQSREPVGYLAELAAIKEAETHEARGDQLSALDIYERLSKTKTFAPDDILWRVGHAARLAGLNDRATQAYARIYYDFPLSDQAVGAGGELESGPIAAGSARYTKGLERAERLFTLRRYSQARIDYESVRAASQGDDRDLVTMRLAEIDYFLKRYRQSRIALKPFADRGPRQAEALFFVGMASHGLKEDVEFQKNLRRVVDEFPAQSWSEDAINELGDYHVVHDEDDKADEAFRELNRRFPAGRFGERASWKVGWWAYRNRRYADAAAAFDRGSVDYPRSDYRPMWLYWSGRAYEGLKDGALASARYNLSVTDYANTYHGRLAAKRLIDLGQPAPERRLVVDVRRIVPTAGSVGPTETPPPTPAQPANAAVIRALVAAQLYDQAVDELKYAQRVWANSSVIEATLAWIYSQQARSATSTEQFNLLRGAINAMKRAYPHYLAAGGEDLPVEILRVIFPIAYWDLIQKYSAENNLDPYLSAALIAQESTFVADIKSYANAVGLTQLMAPTARQYARLLNITYSPKVLTTPDLNLRVGLRYLAAKIKEFGEPSLALASYNAGERPVHRWVTERPGLPVDEFIDDIPYPQTQGYVKKLLSTAEDYRRIYGPDAPAAQVASASTTEEPEINAPPKPKKKAAAPPPRRKPSTAKKTRK